LVLVVQVVEQHRQDMDSKAVTQFLALLLLLVVELEAETLAFQQTRLMVDLVVVVQQTEELLPLVEPAHQRKVMLAEMVFLAERFQQVAVVVLAQ
jgi:hypothetical protein